MTYMRLDTVSAVDGSRVIEYSIPEKKYGEYCVDRSHFQPISEAVKQLTAGQSAGGILPDVYYDFPNGRDTGMRVPVDRLHGISDITEISTAVREQNAKLAADLRKVEKQRARDAKVKALTEQSAKVAAQSTAQSTSATPAS